MLISHQGETQKHPRHSCGKSNLVLPRAYLITVSKFASGQASAVKALKAPTASGTISTWGLAGFLKSSVDYHVEQKQNEPFPLDVTNPSRLLKIFGFGR